jgi:hypothetical protein
MTVGFVVKVKLNSLHRKYIFVVLTMYTIFLLNILLIINIFQMKFSTSAAWKVGVISATGEVITGCNCYLRSGV